MEFNDELIDETNINISRREEPWLFVNVRNVEYYYLDLAIYSVT